MGNKSGSVQHQNQNKSHVPQQHQSHHQQHQPQQQQSQHQQQHSIPAQPPVMMMQMRPPPMMRKFRNYISNEIQMYKLY